MTAACPVRDNIKIRGEVIEMKRGLSSDLLQLISEGKLSWWLPWAYLVVALVAGILLANRLFRDVSWEWLITSKPMMTWRGMYHNGLGWYLTTIIITTILVFGVLVYYTILYVRNFQ